MMNISANIKIFCKMIKYIFFSLLLVSYAMELLALDADNICRNADSYIYHCKPHACDVKMKDSSVLYSKNLRLHVVGEKDKKCIYKYLIRLTHKTNLKNYDFEISCKLSDKGKIAAAEEFQQSLNDDTVYGSFLRNKILESECIPMVKHNYQ